MNNGQVKPESEATEFDRLYAADDAVAPSQPEHGQQIQDGAKAPAAPAAAAEAPDRGSEAAPDDGGQGGGTQPVQAGAAETDPQDDWMAALPPDVRKRVEDDRKAAEDRYNALHGRVGPTQRALSEAQQRLAQLQQVPVAQQPPVQASGQTLDSYFDSDDWKRWADDFPGDAKVVRAGIEAQHRASQDVIQQLSQQVQDLAQRLGQTEHVASRTILNEEISRLESKHPDWQELNQSDDFWGWFDGYRATLPKSVRPMYYDDAKLRECFNDAEFTIDILDRYKAANHSGNVVAAPAAPVQTDSTQNARQAANPRLSMGVEPDVRGSSQVPRPVPLDSLTPEQQFDHVWKTTE